MHADCIGLSITAPGLPFPLLDAPFTRAHGNEAGLSDNALARLRPAGAAAPTRSAGSTSLPQRPDSIELRCQALRLVVPEDAFVCDRTAAWLHVGPRARRPTSTWTYRRSRASDPATAARCATASAAAVSAPSCQRDLIVLAWIDGHHTAADSARPRPAAARRRTCKPVRHGHLLGLEVFSHDELLAEMPRFDRQRGVVVLRVLVPLADGGSDSFAETALRRRWHDAGLPRPRTQISVRSRGRESTCARHGPRGPAVRRGVRRARRGTRPRTSRTTTRRDAWLRRRARLAIEVIRKEHVFGRQQDAEHLLGSRTTRLERAAVCPHVLPLGVTWRRLGGSVGTDSAVRSGARGAAAAVDLAADDDHDRDRRTSRCRPR